MIAPFAESNKWPSFCGERADRTALSIAAQHADDGYSRLGNFGGSLADNFTVCFSVFARRTKFYMVQV